METPTKSIALEDGGRLEVWQSWIDADEALAIFERLRHELPWQQKDIRIAGRSVSQPRLTAWIGDPDAIYTYSGLKNSPLPWTQTLVQLRLRLAEETGHAFNSVLANLYRDENDSMGWHSDKEKELGANPVIASLSLGATRRFRLQHRKRKERKLELALEAGSLLLMRGTTQHYWKHCVPKERHATGPRINLTFRYVLPTEAAKAPPTVVTGKP